MNQLWLMVRDRIATGPKGVSIRLRQYWTGGAHGRGKSWAERDAYPFHSATSARECCGTQDELRDSDEWKPVKASIEYCEARRRRA